MSIDILIMGLFVGFLVGLTGVGAASLLTPILVAIGIHPSIAVGTDLVYNSVTKLFGTVRHWRQKTIHLEVAKYLAYGSIPGAVTAILVLHRFDRVFHDEQQVMKHVLGYVLMLAAVGTLLQLLFARKLKSSPLKMKPTREKRTLTIAIGAVLGFIVGLSSIGSGSLFALAMLALYQMKGSEVVGTDIAHRSPFVLSCRL